MTTSRSDSDAPAILGRLDHVGIAVPSIDAALARYRMLLGEAAVGTPFDLPDQGVRVAFVDAPNAQIELIEPLGQDSPIVRFLQKNPNGGQHHLCFEVPDIAKACAVLREEGLEVLGSPRLGAHGTPVIFLHPKGTGGVLIELAERAEAGH